MQQKFDLQAKTVRNEEMKPFFLGMQFNINVVVAAVVHLQLHKGQQHYVSK